MTDAVLYTYTIYDHPLDIPTGWVVREWIIGRPGRAQAGRLLIVAGDLKAAREAIPPGLVMIPRSNEDDPYIVETWL